MAPKSNPQKGKPKAQSPRVAAAPAAVPPAGPSLDDLLLSLDRHVKANEYKQIVKIADQILAVAPGDAEALQCKVIALIQDDNIDQALSVIGTTQNSGVDLNFHKAYCLYRRNRLQEAMAALKDLERISEVLQLEAQIAYRQGELGVCINSYQTLFQKHKIDSMELKTNIIAAYISGGKSSEVPALMETMKVTPSNSFELAYNAACALIENGSYSKAEEFLLLARRIGQEMLIEEDYTEEEIENELAPISVQLAYVQQVQGHTTEAMESYNSFLKKKLTDAPSIAVASNNLIALRGTKDLFDSLKKFDRLLEKKSEQGLHFQEGLEHKLSARQKEAISFNRFLVLFHSNKLEQARELVSALLDNFPDSVIATVLHASLLVREGKLNRAEEMLGQYADKHPSNSTTALLVRAQIAALAGHHLVAAESLERIVQLQHRPGVVATVVTLKEKGGDLQGSEETLNAALQWWENHMGEDAATLELLMQEAAAYKLKHKNLEAAAELFQKLAKSSSPSVRAQALIGIVCSTAQTDLGKAESYEQQLPPLPGLSGIDVTALERTVGAVPSTIGVKRSRVGDDTVMEGGLEKTKNRNKKKRKRKPRYPKGFDTANPGPPPDPERWLPKRERSSYRPKKKDRRTAQVRGAQGAIAKDKAAESSVTTANGPSMAGPSKSAANISKPSGSAPSSDGSKASSSNSQKSKKKFRR